MHVDDARHDRLARDVDALRAGGHRTDADGPIAVMRLPSTTIVPFSITWRPDRPASAAVMMRAPTSAIDAVRHVALGA